MINGRVMAPVLVITYDRLEHLKRTIASLQGNIHAEQTDLFVASDFQHSVADAGKVDAVRKYLKGVDGFKSVTVFERERNYGVVQNSAAALEVLFEKHDRFIIMNDDLVTAPGFLKFMNEAFERYGTNERVFSITGYCPSIHIPSSYSYDAFFLKRMNAWGCGMTKVRYESVLEISRQEYDEFAANKELCRSFAAGGNDLPLMLKNVAYGVYQAWDARCIYTQFLANQFTLYPAQSLVQNIGCDGSGMHCGVTDMYDVTLSDKIEFRFPDEVAEDSEIVRENYRFQNRMSLKRLHFRIGNRVRGIFKRIFS